MNLQLTQYAIDLLDSNTGPVTLDKFRLGNGYGYVPLPTDIGLHGATVYTGEPSPAQVVNGNVVKYSMLLDFDVGDFDYGELSLWHNGNLFALGAASSLHRKFSPSASSKGNSVRFDVYLQISGDYDMWLNTAETNNEFRMAVFNTVDLLPPSSKAVPNAYVIKGAASNQSAFMAYTDRNGLWNFDAYKYNTSYKTYVVTAATHNSVTVSAPDQDVDLERVSDFGMKIAQFDSGALYGICRYVRSVQRSGNSLKLSFESTLTSVPVVGSTFRMFFREPLSVASLMLPIATATTLGAIRLGNGLKGDPLTGIVDIDLDSYTGNLVTSVNNKTGIVELKAADIPNSVLTVNGAAPDASGNVTVTVAGYTLPIATSTTLGGVKSKVGGYVTVSATGELDLSFTPVTAVNGRSGEVVVKGYVDPQSIPSGADLNTYTQEGKFFSLDGAALTNGPSGATGPGQLLVSLLSDTTTGTSIQMWTQANAMWVRSVSSTVQTPWVSVGGSTGFASVTAPGIVKVGPTLTINSTDATLDVKVATTAALGVVRVGAGLDITQAGILSAKLRTVNGVAPDANGNVVIDGHTLGVVTDDRVGVQGGVPGYLGQDPNANPEDADMASDFQYNRMPALQLPKAAVVFCGTWNASTNSCTDIGTYIGSAYSKAELLADGKVKLTYTEDGTEKTATHSGLGMKFRVSVAGGTSLDGNSSWSEDDFVLGADDRWCNLSSSGGGGQTSIVEVATLPTTFAANTIYVYTGTSHATVNVNNITGNEITIIAQAYTVKFTGNVVPSSSGGTTIVGGGIASLIKLPDGAYYLYGDTAT